MRDSIYLINYSGLCVVGLCMGFGIEAFRVKAFGFLLRFIRSSSSLLFGILRFVF